MKKTLITTLCLSAVLSLLAQELRIQSFDNNGRLVFNEIDGATSYSVFMGTSVADLKASVRGNRLIVLQPDEYPADEWAHTPKGYVFTLP